MKFRLPEHKQEDKVCLISRTCFAPKDCSMNLPTQIVPILAVHITPLPTETVEESGGSGRGAKAFLLVALRMAWAMGWSLDCSAVAAS